MGTLEEMRSEIDKVLKENISIKGTADIELHEEEIIISNIGKKVTMTCTYEELVAKLHKAVDPFIGKILT